MASWDHTASNQYPKFKALNKAIRVAVFVFCFPSTALKPLSSHPNKVKKCLAQEEKWDPKLSIFWKEGSKRSKSYKNYTTLRSVEHKAISPKSATLNMHKFSFLDGKNHFSPQFREI